MSDEKKTPPILGKRFSLAEQQWNVWQATVEAGTPFERILEPDYWAHQPTIHKIQPYEKIEVRVDDQSFYAELLITDVGKQWIKVKKLTYIKLEASKNKDIDLGSVIVHFAGPLVKHQVIRKSDKEVLQDKISKLSDAIEAGEQFQNKMAS